MPVAIFVFLVALLVGVPVFIALALSSLIYTHFIAGIPDFVILHRMAGGLDSFPLLAVPFFILAGNLMNSAGITNRIYDFAVATCGWMRGGLAHVNIFGSVIFAGAVVQPGTTLGRHAILNTGCSVDHDCLLGDHVHLCPGTHLAGTVRVGAGTMLGAGTSVLTSNPRYDSIQGFPFESLGLAGLVVLEHRPPQLLLIWAEAQGLRLAGAARLLLSEGVQIVEPADEQQIGDLLDNLERIGDTSRPEGIPNSIDLALQLPGDQLCLPLGVRRSSDRTRTELYTAAR